MVYDCFQFFNELDILLLRMHILNDVVDKFVISESTVTFSGDPKPLFYEENKDMFKEFEGKIIHNVVYDTPMDCDAFTRDHHQKCAVGRGIAGCKDDDIIIFSDVDEIPNVETLKKILPDIEPGKIYMLAQRLFIGSTGRFAVYIAQSRARTYQAYNLCIAVQTGCSVPCHPASAPCRCCKEWGKDQH